MDSITFSPLQSEENKFSVRVIALCAITLLHWQHDSVILRVCLEKSRNINPASPRFCQTCLSVMHSLRGLTHSLFLFSSKWCYPVIPLSLSLFLSPSLSLSPLVSSSPSSSSYCSIPQFSFQSPSCGQFQL